MVKVVRQRGMDFREPNVTGLMNLLNTQPGTVVDGDFHNLVAGSLDPWPCLLAENDVRLKCASGECHRHEDIICRSSISTKDKRKSLSQG